jgi:hypothetical protein
MLYNGKKAPLDAAGARDVVVRCIVFLLEEALDPEPEGWGNHNYSVKEVIVHPVGIGFVINELNLIHAALPLALTA